MLTELQEVAVEKMAKAEKLSPMQVADAEDIIGDWLADHGVGDGWDLAATLVAAGVDEGWLDEIADAAIGVAVRRDPLGDLCAGDRATDDRNRGLPPSASPIWSEQPNSIRSSTVPPIRRSTCMTA